MAYFEICSRKFSYRNFQSDRNIDLRYQKFCYNRNQIDKNSHFCYQVSVRAYFIKRTRNRNQTFWKSGPRHLEKADPIPKFTVWVKDSLKANLRVLISNMTIVFYNSSSKVPKQGIFDPNFRHFHFFTKFRKLTNSRVLISNMKIVF